jgi:CBS domain-containing protein
MRIRKLVNGVARVCGPDMSLEEAARMMIEEETGSLGVVDGTRLVGIVTERDVLRAAAQSADFLVGTVAEWMTPDPDTAGPEIPVDDVAQWMLAAGYRHLPVVDGTELLGIASIKDVLWALHSISTEPQLPDHAR